MHNHYLKVAAAMALGFSGIADAATEQDAIEACARIAAESIEKRQGVMPKVSLGKVSGERNYSLHGVTLYHLDAVNPSTNEVVMRLDCTVNRHARVLSVRKLSVEAGSAESRGKGRAYYSPINL